MKTAVPTVAEIATSRPHSIPVFQRHGIDFCCGGRRGLDEACTHVGVELHTVLDEIAVSEQHKEADTTPWDQAPLPQLIDHIVERHHRPLDEELPRIEALARQVLETHRNKDPDRLAAILRTFEAMRDDLVPHLKKEEMVLFPWIRSGRGAEAQGPVKVMLYEHEALGRLLDTMRELTDGYQPPAEACGTWQALYRGLGDLDQDLQIHIHLENNLLFPRALQEG